jgi:hypothetical protein
MSFWQVSNDILNILGKKSSAVYSYLSLMKLIGATSLILFCNFKKCIPFSVVLKVFVPSPYCIKPFSTNSDKYSFNWLKDINALYINLVLVAPPPSAAFKSSSIMSLLLLYFTFYLESNYLYMESQAYVNFHHMVLFRCCISWKYLYVQMCDGLEECHAQLMCWTCVMS